VTNFYEMCYKCPKLWEEEMILGYYNSHFYWKNPWTLTLYRQKT